MSTHKQKIERIAKQLKEYKSAKPVSLKKKAVSHEVPKPQDKRHLDEKIDISDLNEILLIDPDKKICVAEPGVTFVDLVKETIKYGLAPYTVPELKTITIGGAVAGCSIESMSFKYGGFHDSCVEYEVITAKGDVLTCRPDNENSLIFQMMHGTFGTLGIISKLTFKLLPAKPYVKMKFEKYNNIEDYKAAIWKHFESRDVDYMDGMIHSPSLYVLSLGNFVDEAPYTSRYDWTKVFFHTMLRRKEDYLRTPDYFFRYDKGLTTVRPKSWLGRFLFRKFLCSTFTLNFVQKFHKLIPPKAIPFTLDTFIPFSRIVEFLKWYDKEINYYPLWVVPYKTRCYEWVNPKLFGKTKDPLFIDIAIYGMRKKDNKNYYRMVEKELMKIGGIKTLISNNFGLTHS